MSLQSNKRLAALAAQLGVNVGDADVHGQTFAGSIFTKATLSGTPAAADTYALAEDTGLNQRLGNTTVQDRYRGVLTGVSVSLPGGLPEAEALDIIQKCEFYANGIGGELRVPFADAIRIQPGVTMEGSNTGTDMDATGCPTGGPAVFQLPIAYFVPQNVTLQVRVSAAFVGALAANVAVGVSCHGIWASQQTSDDDVTKDIPGARFSGCTPNAEVISNAAMVIEMAGSSSVAESVLSQ